MTIGEAVAQILAKKDVLNLGEIQGADVLLKIVGHVNNYHHQIGGEGQYRLPTQDELITARDARDTKFGNRFTWGAGEGRLSIHNMRIGSIASTTGDTPVEAYLILEK